MRVWTDLMLKDCEQHSDSWFLKYVDSQNLIVERSFREFRRDLQVAMVTLERRIPLEATQLPICFSNEGSYELLPFFLAALVLGKRVIILNPSEVSEVRKAQIGPALYLSDLKLDPSLSDFFVLPKNIESTFEIGFFTSGSSGLPKLIFHKENIINKKIEMYLQEFGSIRSIASSLPMNHVYNSIFVFLTSIASGRKSLFFQNFLTLVKNAHLLEEDVEAFAGTPSILRILCSSEKKFLRIFRNINIFFSAGSMLSRDLASAAKSLYSFKLIPLYGTTETAGSILYLPPEAEPEWLIKEGAVCNGVPFFGIEISIIKDGQRLSEESELGEIQVRSHLGEDNYFLPGTFEFIFTGDLGYFKIDQKEGRKYYFIAGRKKDVFKRNEIQISIHETESIFDSWARNHQCQCIAVEFPNQWMGSALGVVILISEQGHIDSAALKDWVDLHFPRALRPNVILWHLSDGQNLLKPNREAFAKKFQRFEDQKLTGIQIQKML